MGNGQVDADHVQRTNAMQGRLQIGDRNVERQVLPIHLQRGERRIVHCRRCGMGDGVTEYPDEFGRAVDFHLRSVL